MRGALPEIHAHGAELLIIGNGTPEMAADFREEVGLTTPLYTDPTLKSYALAGLKHGVGTSFSLRMFSHALRAFRAGFRQTRTKGAPFQQGGVLVVQRGGKVVYGYASEVAGDHPPVGDVLAALRRL